MIDELMLKLEEYDEIKLVTSEGSEFVLSLDDISAVDENFIEIDSYSNQQIWINFEQVAYFYHHNN